MSLKEVTHTDKDGRMSVVRLPDSASESESHMGILVGPPSLESLELPLDVEVRLHNQLFERKLFTLEDVRRKHGQLMAAMMAAFKPHTSSLMRIYMESKKEK